MKLIFTLIFTAYSIAAIPISVTKGPDGIKIHCLNSANNPLLGSPAYKNVRIVELEKVPFFQRINNIRKLEMNDDYLFVQTSEKLYTYTLNGELMAEIGRKGEREDDYSELSTFYIDNKKKQITIIDGVQNKLINYNFWGNYMFTDTISEGAFKWCYQTLLINNNQLLNYHGMSMDNTEPYSLFDLTKKEVIKRYFSYQPITLGNYVYPFSWHPMTRADKDIDVIMPLCDTVYTYSAASSSFQPKYIIEMTQKMAPKNKIRKNTPSYSGDLLKLDQQGYFTGFDGIYETDTKILLQYMYGITLGYFLFDKYTKTGSFYLYSSSDKGKTFPFNVIVHSYKNEFVAFGKGKELRSLTHIKDKKVREKIESLGDNSACLIFYELE